MSQAYRSNGSDSVRADRVDGYPPVPQQRGYEYGPEAGHEDVRYPGGGYQLPPNYAQPSVGPHFATPTRSIGSRRMVVIAGALGAITLGLAGLTVVTHGNLSDARAQTAQVEESLQQAEKSLSAQRSELDKAQEQLKASNQLATEAGTALESAVACAAYLNRAWDAVFAEDYDAADAALSAASEICEPVLASATK